MMGESITSASPSPVPVHGVPCAAVLGYMTRSVLVRPQAIVLTVAEHSHPDSASRPLVAISPPPCGGRSATNARRLLVARVGAPPVLLSATATGPHEIVTRWSRPAFISNTHVPSPLSLRSSSGTRIRISTINHPAGSAIAVTVVDAQQVAVVRYAPTATVWVEDAHHNRAPAAVVGVTQPRPTTPGLVDGVPEPTPTTPGPAESVTTPPSATPAGWNVLSNPIDPTQLTNLPFGARSFWMQPWRAYLETVPTQTLLESVGINFNVTPQEAPATAHLLAASGFQRARIEIGWDQISYSDETKLADPASWTTILQALRDNGLRPLILLNANAGLPGPSLPWTARITAPAPAGATTVQLDPTSAAAVVPSPVGSELAHRPIQGGRRDLYIGGSRRHGHAVEAAAGPAGAR